ncbi:MAG: hypothetical protein ACXV5H_04880 [Halobacteriota archaeon]
MFYGKFHRTLLQFVEGLPSATGTRVFIFSTSGDGKKEHHAAFRELLVSRGFSLWEISPAKRGTHGGR